MNRRDFMKGIATTSLTLGVPDFALASRTISNDDLSQRIASLPHSELERVLRLYKEEYGENPHYDFWLPSELYADMRKRRKKEEISGYPLEVLKKFFRPYNFDEVTGPKIYTDIAQLNWKTINFSDLSGRLKDAAVRTEIRERLELPNLTRFNPELSELFSRIAPHVNCTYEFLLHLALCEGSLLTNPEENHLKAKGPLQILPSTFEDVKKTKLYSRLSKVVEENKISEGMKPYTVGAISFLDIESRAVGLKNLKTENPVDVIAAGVLYHLGPGSLSSYSSRDKATRIYVPLILGLYSQETWNNHIAFAQKNVSPFPRLKKPILQERFLS